MKAIETVQHKASIVCNRNAAWNVSVYEDAVYLFMIYKLNK